MPIRFACPHCEKTLKVDDRFGGRRAKCPNCRVPIEIPEQSVAKTPVEIAGPAIPSETIPEPGDRPAGGEALPKPAPDVDAARSATNLIAGDAAPSKQEAAREEGVPAPATSQIVPKTPPPFESIAATAGQSTTAGPPAEVPPQDSDDEPFASPFEVFDDDAEFVYAEGYGREESERFLVSRTRLAIPRAFVYMQGALLVAVAVLSFTLGWAFGGSGAFRTAEAPRGPVTLSGTIRVEGYDGPIAASAGALVAILPGERRPSEKIAVDGLRPSEIGRIVPPRTLGAIREMGGALAVSDSRGEFSAELPQPGEYHVLAVLPDVYRPTTSQIALADLARLGDYFLLPDQLIGDCRYALQTERIDESETIEIRFP